MHITPPPPPNFPSLALTVGSKGYLPVFQPEHSGQTRSNLDQGGRQAVRLMWTNNNAEEKRCVTQTHLASPGDSGRAESGDRDDTATIAPTPTCIEEGGSYQVEAEPGPLISQKAKPTVTKSCRLPTVTRPKQKRAAHPQQPHSKHHPQAPPSSPPPQIDSLPSSPPTQRFHRALKLPAGSATGASQGHGHNIFFSPFFFFTFFFFQNSQL